jgi:hypothetical protein
LIPSLAGRFDNLYLTYRPTRIHRLEKSIPWNRFLGSLNVYKYGLCTRVYLEIFSFSVVVAGTATPPMAGSESYFYPSFFCIFFWLMSPSVFLGDVCIRTQRAAAASRCTTNLKGHGNEADFLWFLQKLGRHRFLTVHFEPFRFRLRFRGDIRN